MDMLLLLMMEVVKSFLLAYLWAIALTTIPVHAQNQSGFISLDCGLSTNDTYIDEVTGINYESDAAYIDTGVSMNISSKSNATQQYLNVRSFPQGMRNCYILRPSNLQNTSRYLIRASFLYGNYDSHQGGGQPPEFDIHLGVSRWDSVSFFDSDTIVTKDIIHVISSKIVYVCLINTGSGTPFISLLELRPMGDGNIYQSESGSLLLYKRLNFGSSTNNQVRYKDDSYDRIWEPFSVDGKRLNNTPTTINLNSYMLPLVVIGTAITPTNANEPLQFYWNFAISASQFYIYMHFAELQLLQANQSRNFTVFINEELWYGPFTPDYLDSNTIYSITPQIKEWLNISIYKIENSTLPPIINAMEIFTMKKLLQPQTDQEDADAMINIKSTYGKKRDWRWQGDPCAPKSYVWFGIECSYNASNPPRVISLDLSSSGLTGNVSPYIFNLKLIEYLDLSNNNLSGQVPDFLSQLPFLRVIKLSQNNFTGPIPKQLLEKSKNGTISLSVDEYNTTMQVWTSSSAQNKKDNNNIVAVVASVAALFVVVVALTILWIYKGKYRKGKVVKLGNKANLRGRLLDSTNQKFAYSEVLIITNNFERVIGKGGFGKVYHGHLDNTEVAVKMLSPSSIQGYKEFCTETELLTRVHHRNLTSLVGYCDEGDNIGLIYEYMANGNLREHLSSNHGHPNVLRWDERLRIALDAAQGLEYLHNGCKPPIIHRDVKTTNILLNEKFQAKLADFGLSKVFPVDNTHVSTAIVGTPGYLDPEYYISNKLNEKSDIFSFGVVLLEIITSRPVFSRDEVNAHISQWVNFMLATNQDDDFRSIVDPRLGGDFDVDSAKKIIEIGMACVSHTSIQRPTMNHVVMELKQCLAAEIARINVGHANATGLEDSIGMASFNSYSESILEPR